MKFLECCREIWNIHHVFPAVDGGVVAAYFSVDHVAMYGRAPTNCCVDGGTIFPCSVANREVANRVVDVHVDVGGGHVDGGRVNDGRAASGLVDGVQVVDHVDDREDIDRVEDDHADFVEDDCLYVASS